MSDSVTVKVPSLVPLKTPRELRDATIRDYRRAAERAGARVDPAVLERLAVSDCELADRYKSETARSVPTPGPAKPPADRMTVEGEVNKLGGTTEIDPNLVKRAPLKALHGTDQEDRWMHAKARVARIMAGASSHSDPVQSMSTCEIPTLAYELYRIYANVAIRRRPPRVANVTRTNGRLDTVTDEPNPYFGLSSVDVNRLLQRQVEDVCDRSTGRLGPWRVPK